MVVPPLLHIESGDGDSGFVAPLGDHPAYRLQEQEWGCIHLHIPPPNLLCQMLEFCKTVNPKLDNY